MKTDGSINRSSINRRCRPGRCFRLLGPREPFKKCLFSWPGRQQASGSGASVRMGLFKGALCYEVTLAARPFPSNRPGWEPEETVRRRALLFPDLRRAHPAPHRSLSGGPAAGPGPAGAYVNSLLQLKPISTRNHYFVITQIIPIQMSEIKWRSHGDRFE